MWRLLCGLSLAVPTALFGMGVHGGNAAGNPISPAQLAQLQQNPNQKVIVILKNQHSELSGRATMAARTSAITADQAGVVKELTQVQAQHVTAFHLINAVSATVSKAEVAHLLANPSVRTVVPDRTIRELRSVFRPTGSASAVKPAVATTTGTPNQLCGTQAAPVAK